jgi:hypothetical protein
MIFQELYFSYQQKYINVKTFTIYKNVIISI